MIQNFIKKWRLSGNDLGNTPNMKAIRYLLKRGCILSQKIHALLYHYQIVAVMKKTPKCQVAILYIVSSRLYMYVAQWQKKVLKVRGHYNCFLQSQIRTNILRVIFLSSLMHNYINIGVCSTLDTYGSRKIKLNFFMDWQ